MMYYKKNTVEMEKVEKR